MYSKHMNIAHMNRTELEVAILENDILPTNTKEGIAAIIAMTDDEIRAAIGAWILANDECANC